MGERTLAGCGHKQQSYSDDRSPSDSACGTVLACPGEYQGHIVRLFTASDPVGNGAGHDLADARQRLIAMPLDQLNQTLFAELAKLILRLGDAVAVTDEDISRFHINRAFVVAHPVE